MADCYHHGNGVNADAVTAFHWYLHAAEQGNTLGQIRVAECYCDGFGVSQDNSKAEAWYAKIQN